MVQMRGLAALQRQLRALVPEVREEVKIAINESAQLVRTTAIKKIQRGPKTGKVYRKTSPKRTHRSSAPGEAPATDTGALVSSIKTDVDADGMGAVVEAAKDYALPLELGTRHMAARPFLVPSLRENEATIKRKVAAAAKRGATKAAHKS